MVKKADTQEFRQLLTERRKQIVRKLADTEQTLKFLSESRPPELSEEAQEEAFANSLAALSNQERKELLDIEQALQRIESGEYSLCENCGREIGINRLKAVPTVRLCIVCQEEAEKAASN